MKLAYSLLFLCFFLACTNNSSTSNSKEKISWAVKMADAAIYRFDSLVNYNNPSKKWQYDVAMLGQAIDKLGYIDTTYSNYHKDFIDYFVNEDGSINKYKLENYNLDYVNPAKGLITLYKRTGEEKYLKAINLIVTQIEGQPKTNSGGFWHKKIYTSQMWLDGVYMSSPFIAQFANEFNKPAWFDSVAFQITHIYSKTLDPKTGLLYHAWDESKSQQWCNPETGQSKEFWGRAMGWYMMALVDVLGFFPEDHPSKDTLISIFEKTSEALLKVRDKETGLWYQVLDKGGKEGNYIEGSCSAMFTYAFAKGAKRGFLPEKYNNVANECFEGIVEHLIIEGEDGRPVMKDICAGAGLGGNPYRDGTYEYYISEKKADNDTKGVAPFIMAAIELGK